MPLHHDPAAIRDAAGAVAKAANYRFALRRVWTPDLRRVCWVVLNPSTADIHPSGKIDPTIRRCIGFSRVPFLRRHRGLRIAVATGWPERQPVSCQPEHRRVVRSLASDPVSVCTEDSMPLTDPISQPFGGSTITALPLPSIDKLERRHFTRMRRPAQAQPTPGHARSCPYITWPCSSSPSSADTYHDWSQQTRSGC
ncbi:MAG: DUF1643 domain-containing protein [Planctomycetota bacterium]